MIVASVTAHDNLTHSEFVKAMQELSYMQLRTCNLYLASSWANCLQTRLILCLWRNQAREQTSVDLSHSRETINQVCVWPHYFLYHRHKDTESALHLAKKKFCYSVNGYSPVKLIITRNSKSSSEGSFTLLCYLLYLCLLIWPPQLYVKLNICAWERFVCDEWSVSPHKYLWDWCVRSFSRKNVSINFRGMQKMTVASTIYDGYFHLSLVVSSYFVRLTKRSCTDET